MTIQQIHREFKLFYDKIDSLSFTEITKNQIDEIIYEATLRFIKNKLKEEENQKIREDLKHLLITNYLKQSYSQLYFGNTNQHFFSLDKSNIYTSALFTTNAHQNSNDLGYFLFVKAVAGVEITESHCTTETRKGIGKIEVCSQDDYLKIISDPFNEASPSSIPAIFEGNNIVLSSKDFLIDYVRLTYYRYPIKNNYDNNISIDLSELTHKEIIQLAITVALELIESNRLATNSQLLSTVG